jgi:cytochrome c oxidase subunit I+III
MSARLVEAWRSPRGFAALSAVNHKNIGMRFIVTGFIFFVIGGLQALLIRLQLAVPDNAVIGPDFYNQMFTMHGTTMMFLFAVPILEGFGMYLVPLQVGTRDLPFPRLNAFGYWCYLFGGLFLYSSFLTGQVPDGGWFAYPPFTGAEFSPDLGLDFWLLGVTFVEISAIVGAIELVVVILKRRAPGMSLNRLPLFSWAMLITSFMILFAMPSLIVGSVMLEIERKLGTFFYNPAGGGDPLLWQHLFWFFGHPEVYIMLLPAVGIISMVVPVFMRTRIVGYTFLVVATVAIGLISFGVWVHHMFAVGFPMLTLTFFAGASLVIAIPSGVQVFAWVATIWRGSAVWKAPSLFVVGFLVIFVLGGITGVMVAIVPFNLQVHDSFFVVAHFHYVLIGGVVFPVMAGLYFWIPKISGRMLKEGLSKTSFWLVFIGFNLAFFPQHFLGFLGMPRRVYTYGPGLGWEGHNLVSTLGAFVLASGILVFLIDFFYSLRRGPRAPANPWNAGTLEWAAESPPAPHNFDVIPSVDGRDPLWDQTSLLPEEPRVPRVGEPPEEGRREVINTTILTAAPQNVVSLPGPSYMPLGAALGISLFLFGVLLDLVWAMAAGGVVVAIALIWWLWPEKEQRASKSP